jgi:hypothetical protein
MKKNAQLHILLESSLLKQLKKDSEESGLSLGEYCRKKLRKNSQLDRIEGKLDKLIKRKN